MRKKILIIFFILSFLYILWPFFNIYRFYVAVKTSDIDFFTNNIDWKSLRSGFKDDLEIIFNLALKLIINPFDKVFVPDIELETKYNFKNWILEGYSKGLSFYKFDQPQKIMLKCRNPHSVNKTIEKDQKQKRTDCFNFFRYMNSSLMKRYIDTKTTILQ